VTIKEEEEKKMVPLFVLCCGENGGGVFRVLKWKRRSLSLCLDGTAD